jgi:hypothetical protein
LSLPKGREQQSQSDLDKAVEGQRLTDAGGTGEATDDSDRVRPLLLEQHGCRVEGPWPVLTAPRLDAVTPFLVNELAGVCRLEDVGKHRVDVKVEFGAVYIAPANSRRRIECLSFRDFVGGVIDGSTEYFFIGDAPPQISRAVDSLCGRRCPSLSYTHVKLIFFSQEKQSRTIARAKWDPSSNAFRLTDFESVGLSFAWTVFAADAEKAEYKTTAFPFEVSLRAFNRFQHFSEHAALPIANDVIQLLTGLEHEVLSHGSKDDYISADLSPICDLNAASNDFRVESIWVEHYHQRRVSGGPLIVEAVDVLSIDGFDGKSFAGSRLGTVSGDGSDRREGNAPAKLSYFRAHRVQIHWKMRPLAISGIEEGLAPLADALDYVRTVLSAANTVERTSARGGAAPEAL